MAIIKNLKSESFLEGSEQVFINTVNICSPAFGVNKLTKSREYITPGVNCLPGHSSLCWEGMPESGVETGGPVFTSQSRAMRGMEVPVG